tara:strand:- start:51 stop:203 length:153 start_codon:yes stop_codon:yes gene_type:complete
MKQIFGARENVVRQTNLETFTMMGINKYIKTEMAINIFAQNIIILVLIVI